MADASQRCADACASTGMVTGTGVTPRQVFSILVFMRIFR